MRREETQHPPGGGRVQPEDLQRRDDAVAPERRAEPGHAGVGIRAPRRARHHHPQVRRRAPEPGVERSAGSAQARRLAEGPLRAQGGAPDRAAPCRPRGRSRATAGSALRPAPEGPPGSGARPRALGRRRRSHAHLPRRGHRGRRRTGAPSRPTSAGTGSSPSRTAAFRAPRKCRRSPRRMSTVEAHGQGHGGVAPQEQTDLELRRAQQALPHQVDAAPLEQLAPMQQVRIGQVRDERGVVLADLRGEEERPPAVQPKGETREEAGARRDTGPARPFPPERCRRSDRGRRRCRRPSGSGCRRRSGTRPHGSKRDFRSLGLLAVVHRRRVHVHLRPPSLRPRRPPRPRDDAPVERDVVLRHAAGGEPLLEGAAAGGALERLQVLHRRDGLGSRSGRRSPSFRLQRSPPRRPPRTRSPASPHARASIRTSPKGSGQSIGNSSPSASPRKSVFSLSRNLTDEFDVRGREQRTD